MSAAAAAAAAAPEERPAKKAHSKPRRITDFEHTLDTLLNEELLPDDRMFPTELIELITEYVAPCNPRSWTELRTNTRMTYFEHGWDPAKLYNRWECWHCFEKRPLNPPL